MGRYRLTFVLALATLFAATTLLASNADARRYRKRTKKKKVSAVKAKALDSLRKPYKWGMSVKQVLKVIKRGLKEKYDAKIQATRDPYVQDKLRKKMRIEFNRIAKSLVSFSGKNRSWDISIIDKEFAQRNGEQMLIIWENKGGKNQRKFFFFYRKRLYKILTALDMSKFKNSQRDFYVIKKILERKFGGGIVSFRKVDGIKEATGVSWYSQHNHVRASDKLRFHGTFVLAVESRKIAAACYKARPPVKKKTKSNIVKSMTSDPNDKPDLNEGSSTIDNLIKGKK